MGQTSYNIVPLGDSALVLEFGNVIDESLNAKVLAICKAISNACFQGIKDVIPAYSSLTIHYDVVSLMKDNNGESAFTKMKHELERLVAAQGETCILERRKLQIPVCYAEKFGWDIGEIATGSNLPVEEVVRLHSSNKYKVYMLGFLPGFPYMGMVHSRIAFPRKREPRLRIDEGSVGIAGGQTGIYPVASPGGWQIIGRTPLKIFDKNKKDPVLFAPGDEVEFFSISEDEFHHY